MTTKLLLPLALACLLLQVSGCKKKDDKNLFISQHNVTFGYSDATKTINISNIGSTGFTWSVSTVSDLLEFSKTSGSCSKNNPDAFDINLLREKVHQDSIITTVTVTASTGETTSISLLILGFPEKKIRYNSQVYDAAYDRVNDKLVLLSYTNQSFVLDILNVGTKNFTHIPLPGDGSFLSVSPDGTYAVTSSDNNSRVTYTDLVQNKVISTFSVEEFNHGIIASRDKYCYYFPYYNNNDIGKLNLSTGIYTSFNYSSYLDISMAVLHPSGNYLYTAGYSMLAKFNISNPQPDLVYTNTNYNTDSKIWISGDGTKIFTAAKKVLTIEPTLPQNDITGVADVNIGQNYIFYLGSNPVYNEFYIIPSNSSYGTDYQSNQLLVLNNSLAPVRTIPLEQFYISNSYYEPGYTKVDATGEYVFSSSDGNKIIVISQAYSYSSDWGIEIIDRNWK